MKVMSKLLLLLILGLGWTGCLKEPVTNCCDDEPISETVDSIWIAIPNVFTPNGDGQNDIFRPVIQEFEQEYYDNQTQQHVSIHRKITTASLKVMKMNGRSLYDGQVNSVKDLFGWNGKDGSGEVCEGKFLWEIKITTDKGTTKEYSGQVCSFVTSDEQQNVECEDCVTEAGLISSGGLSPYIKDSDYLLYCE